LTYVGDKNMTYFYNYSCVFMKSVVILVQQGITLIVNVNC